MFSVITSILKGYDLPEQTHKIVTAILLLSDLSPRLYIYGDTIQILLYGQMTETQKHDILGLGFRLSVSGNVIIDL